MNRPARILTVSLGLLLASCSQEAAPQPISPVEAPDSQPTPAVGYVCESGRTIAVAYPDAQTARLSYEGRDRLLTNVVSASGARYAGEGLEWRTISRGGRENAVLSRLEPGGPTGGAVIERCSRPVAASAPPPSGAPCSGADLSLAVEGGDAGMGRRVTTLALRNAGAAACSMTGYPAVSLIDDGGQALTSVRGVQTPGDHFAQGRSLTTVKIEPRQAAYFDLAWSVIPREDRGERACPSVKTVRVRAPGASATVALDLAFAPCGGQVEVSPVRPVADASAGPASTSAG